MFRSLTLTAAIAAMSFGAAASALTAEQKVYKEVRTQTPTGEVKLTREAAKLVTPGENVIYALEFKNDKAEPAGDIVLTMPIPKDVAYIEGSAETQLASLTYSADNGDSFSSRESVMTIDNDGSLRPAKPEELTHIRWSVSEEIAPNAGGELSFKGRLK